MVNLVDILIGTLIQFAVALAIFLTLTFIGDYIYNRLKGSSNKFLNPREFLPEDEIHTLRQVGYLVMMGLCFINFFYSLISYNGNIYYFAAFDIILSFFIAVSMDKSSLKNKVLWILLVPYGSLTYIIFHSLGVIAFVELIRIFVFMYLVKVYFDKFMEYTHSNGLGVTIMLLFVIIVVSFFVTQIVEGVNPLDALVMVSNAFTSNGYAVLGNSVVGKINSLFLVWGGYIISGAGTATLTAAILLRHFNKRVEALEKIIEEGGDNDG